MPQNANSGSAALPPETVRFTVDQQQRLEALNFASLLVAKELEGQRFASPASVDHSSRQAEVLATANAYYDFLTAGEERGELAR